MKAIEKITKVIAAYVAEGASEKRIFTVVKHQASGPEIEAIFHHGLHDIIQHAIRNKQVSIERESVIPARKTRTKCSPAEKKALEKRIRDEHESRGTNFILSFMNDFELDLTEKFLTSTFALGDGTEVNWRNATRANHVQRLQLLQNNIIGNAQVAAMHQKAIEMLDAKRVSCLGKIK